MLMVWFQISWTSTTSNGQNVWSVYMLENHSVTRTIHSSSNESDSDKRLHSIPKFAISFQPHRRPPTNHSPHLLRQSILQGPPHLTSQQPKLCQIPAGASQHVHVDTASLLSSWITTPETHLEAKYCFYQTTTFYEKRIHTCKTDLPWSRWTSTYLFLWTQ